MANSLILDSLEIRNFRRFRHLRIEHLGRVNLIVGQNNIGKTSLLEALWLYAERGAPAMIWQLLRARHESKNGLSDLDASEVVRPEERLQAFKSLFYGHQNMTFDLVPDSIEIGPIASDVLSIAMMWHTEEASKRVFMEAVDKHQKEESIKFRIKTPVLLVKWREEVQSFYLISKGKEEVDRTSIKALPHIFLPADGLSSSQINDFWENIVLTDLEDKVIQALRLIAPKIQRVNLTSSRNGSRQRIPMTRIANASKPISLRSLGEGTNHLFDIALALVNAENGLLLIDEIESGLHQMVLPEMWRLIFKLASQLNIQVFATCHSWDCLEAFAQAVRDTSLGQEEALLISLREHQFEEGTVAAVLFDEEEVDIVASEQMEVR